MGAKDYSFFVSGGVSEKLYLALRIYYAEKVACLCQTQATEYIF